MLRITDVITEIIKHLPGQHDQSKHAGTSIENHPEDISVPFNKKDLDTLDEAFPGPSIWNNHRFVGSTVDKYPYLILDAISIMQKDEDVIPKLKELGQFALGRFNGGGVVTSDVVSRLGEFPPYVKVYKTTDTGDIEAGNVKRTYWQGYASGVDPVSEEKFILTSALWHVHDGCDLPCGTIEFLGKNRKAPVGEVR